jgi:hypothetical protein
MSAACIRDAIEKTSKLLAEQAEKVKPKNVPATARLLDGLRSEVSGPNAETLHTDMPPAMGGAASAPNPGCAQWGDQHSPVACTARIPPGYTLEVDVV